MSLLVYLSLVVAGILAVLLLNAGFHQRFKQDTAKLRSFSDEELTSDISVVRSLFAGKSQPERVGNATLWRLADTHERGLLQNYDFEESLQRLRNAIADSSSMVRAIAGIVIILGLLVTLFNLRSSVGHLQTVFDNMKSTSAQIASAKDAPAPADASTESDALQSAMAGIASSASNAFGISAAFISLACGLLIGVSVWTRFVRSSVFQFEAAVRHIYFVVVPTKQDEAQLIGDLSQAVQNLHELSETFKETNTTLLRIGGFGDRFEDAAKAISDAVAKIPEGMRESVSDMSGTLARDIAAELEHYIEHIKHIEAIYGDQQTLVTAIVKGMSNMEQDSRRSSEALAELRALPDTINQLKGTVGGFVSTSHTLQTSVSQLQSKVDALPVNELAGAAHEMRELSGNLAPLVSAVQDVSSRMKQLIAETLETSQQESRQRLVETLTGFESRLNEALSKGLQSLTAEQKAELAGMNAIATSLKGEMHRLGAGQNLKDLAARLESLTAELARVPKLPKIFSKKAVARPA